jgi:copper(I)-binding protein
MRLPILIGGLLLLAQGSLALADDFRANDVEIVEPWARATAPGETAAMVFMKLDNTGNIADRLLRASTPAADRVELHGAVVDAADIQMQAVKAIELPPGVDVMLQPGGLHLMLIGLKDPLEKGETVPLTLTFERGGMVDITAEVTDAGATEPPPDE